MGSNGVALVTGAAGGMGQEIAAGLGELGFDLALHYNTGEESAAELRKRLDGDGVRAEIFQADFRGGFDAAALVDPIVESMGDITCVVFAHGSVGYCPYDELTDDVWSLLFDVNVTAPFRLIRRIAPDMVGREAGRIIAVSGSIGHVGAVGRTHVASSKAALEMLVKSVAREVGPSGVTANLVAPGPTNSPLLLESTHPRYREPEDLPLRRFAEIADIAAAVSFLASDKAKSITGQTLRVNCGDVITAS